MISPTSDSTATPPDGDVIDLLRAHDYFRGVSEAALDETVRRGTLSHYDAAALIHDLGDPLTSVSFVLRGRVKAVRIDSSGNEHLFQLFQRGDQYGLMLGGLGESLSIRVVALEPSIILTLDYEKGLELTILYPDLRRQWLQSYARSLRQRFLEEAPRPTPKMLALLHQSPATQNIAEKIIERLQGFEESVCVLSDAGSGRSVPGVRFRSLSDGKRLMDVPEIRRQITEWSHARRIVVDTTAATDLDWAVLLSGVDSALLFVRPNDVRAAIERLCALDVKARGWLDKIAVVWVLDEGCRVSPDVPEIHDLAKRQFKLWESPLPHPLDHVHFAGMERLIHHLRGIRIGVALGGGAARGMAHLGVLKVLDDNGIVPDVVAGTSVGAMTGILYSAGLNGDFLANQFATDLEPPWFFRRLPSGGYWYLLYKYRRRQFEGMLRKFLDDWKLEQLALPCLSVTVDLVGGRPVVRERGDAVQAILESINLPVLSTPICRDGQVLIDGGFMNNIPTDVLASQDCNFVIAVSVTAKIKDQFGSNTPATPTPSMRTPSSLRTLFRTLEVQNFNRNRIGEAAADVVVEPEVVDFDLSEFVRARELALVGEKAALTQLPKIKQLLGRLDPALFGRTG
jgi:NTE family protein